MCYFQNDLLGMGADRYFKETIILVFVLQYRTHFSWEKCLKKIN